MKSIVNSPRIKPDILHAASRTEQKNKRTQSLFNNTQKSVSFVDQQRIVDLRTLDKDMKTD